MQGVEIRFLVGDQDPTCPRATKPAGRDTAKKINQFNFLKREGDTVCRFWPESFLDRASPTGFQGIPCRTKCKLLKSNECPKVQSPKVLIFDCSCILIVLIFNCSYIWFKRELKLSGSLIILTLLWTQKCLGVYIFFEFI